MILIVGSEGAGKKAFAESLGYAAEDISCAVTDDCPVLDHLEKTVFEDPACADSLLPALLRKEVVICNEVGSGIIPALRSDRAAREATGRLCILLAKEAEAVVRLVCGIPQVIKGTLPR